MARVKVYFDAVAIYDERDVEMAVDAFLTGSAPGVSNPSFAPSAPVVGSEVRRQMNLRVTSEAREKAFRPALPPPDIERSPESQARVREMVKQVVANLAAPPDEDPTERHRARLRRTNEVVDAERQYWEAGDREGQDAA